MDWPHWTVLRVLRSSPSGAYILACRATTVNIATVTSTEVGPGITVDETPVTDNVAG